MRYGACVVYCLNPRSSNSPHRSLHHSERSRTDRHSPQQRRPNTLPEPPRTLLRPRLPEAVPHRLILHALPKPISLHLALDDIKRVTRQPQRLSRQPAIKRHLIRRDLRPLHLVARRVEVHQVLERQEPRPVRKRLAPDRHRFPAVQTL